MAPKWEKMQQYLYPTRSLDIKFLLQAPPNTTTTAAAASAKGMLY
jgi:hypothetical protein